MPPARRRRGEAVPVNTRDITLQLDEEIYIYIAAIGAKLNLSKVEVIEKMVRKHMARVASRFAVDSDK